MMELGEAPSIREAIARAMEDLKALDAPPPSTLQIRQHARLMSMQALGEAGYRRRITDMWRWAEELMTAIEHGLPDATTVLMGRAAQGHLDAGLVINLRVLTDESVKQLAAVLVEHGYPEPSFETVNTTVGRLNRLRISGETDGYEAVIMRIKRSLNVPSGRCVFTGKLLATRTIDELREQIAQHER